MKGIYVLLIGLLLSLANPIGSFAHERYNGLPHQVINTLDHQYGNFDLINSKSLYKHGKLRYHLLIQQRGSYVWVTIGANGRLVNQNRYHKYPLANHYCNNECRFHFQHYGGAGFIAFDPFSGCSNHFAVVSGNQNHSHYASFGLSDWYYHPKQKHYKRLKHQEYGYYSHKNRNRENGSRSYRHQKSGRQFQKHSYRKGQVHDHDNSAQRNKTSKRPNGYGKSQERHKQHGRTATKDRQGNNMHYVDPSDAHARRNGY